LAGFMQAWVLVRSTSFFIVIGVHIIHLGFLLTLGFLSLLRFCRCWHWRLHCHCKGGAMQLKGGVLYISGWVSWHVGGMPLATLQMYSWEWRHTEEVVRISPPCCPWFFSSSASFLSWVGAFSPWSAGRWGMHLALRCCCQSYAIQLMLSGWFICGGCKMWR
jgi:hypothetical protein